MKVTLSNGNSIYVDFIIQKKRTGNHTTICLIRDASSTIPKEANELSMGKSKCNKKDKYNKAIGKAKSLERALDELFPTSTIIVDPCTQKQNHQFRMEIWERFYKELRTPDKSKLAGMESWEM